MEPYLLYFNPDGFRGLEEPEDVFRGFRISLFWACLDFLWHFPDPGFRTLPPDLSYVIIYHGFMLRYPTTPTSHGFSSSRTPQPCEALRVFPASPRIANSSFGTPLSGHLFPLEKHMSELLPTVALRFWYGIFFLSFLASVLTMLAAPPVYSCGRITSLGTGRNRQPQRLLPGLFPCSGTSPGASIVAEEAPHPVWRGFRTFTLCPRLESWEVPR